MPIRQLPETSSLTGQYLLGYHGCKKTTGEAILSGSTKHLSKSENDYDWLGSGIYFWIDSPTRAIEWANNHKKTNGEPYAIGAVIQPGRCLNLTDLYSAELIRFAYTVYASATQAAGQALAKNSTLSDGVFLKRNLDCAVINTLLQLKKDEGEAYDSVIGVFEEGKSIFDGSGIKEKTHIQISVINPEACIKGYFRVPGLI